MACATKPAPSAGPSRTASRARRGESESKATRQLAAPARPGQESFAFLTEVPSREKRWQERAHRSHLRERTPAVGQVQLVLPIRFRPRSRTDLLSTERATAMENAVRRAKNAQEGSPRQRAAEALLLELLLPFLRSAVQEALEKHQHTYLTREDLLQEAQLRAAKLWRGFTVGYAGPGRTLYPAYVLKAVRQHLHEKLADAAPVHVTSHARKLQARARRRAQTEGVELHEALQSEGAGASTALALAEGCTAVDADKARHVADESDAYREELAAQRAALEALRRLPRLQRLAVAGPLGLGHRTLSDSLIAKAEGCTLAEVQAARASGLQALRATLGAEA